MAAQQYREQGNMRGHPIPLISAEGELTIWHLPRQGVHADLIFQFSNPILTGNTSGLSTFLRVPWKRAVEFASGLVYPEHGAKARLERGDGVVVGTNYGPVKLELNPMCYQIVFLAPEDCETIAHTIVESAIAATGRTEIRRSWRGIKANLPVASGE